MLRLMRAVSPLLAVAALLCAREASADPGNVGLGIGVGASMPTSGNLPAALGGLRTANFGWGFYVNIPLISTFNITPHAELYNLNSNVTAADLGLEFKFVVPIPVVRPYVGVGAGDTTLSGSQHINVGALVGASIHLIANLDAFLEGRYSIMLQSDEDGGNISTLHLLAGVLFRF